ncbi:MAG: hypothetical protein KKE64_08125, partial [Candidatus Omnitrophica bacterium]|nr:hypothetical protein [Candidatus Omnitrophota bacterium]
MARVFAVKALSLGVKLDGVRERAAEEIEKALGQKRKLVSAAAEGMQEKDPEQFKRLAEAAYRSGIDVPSVIAGARRQKELESAVVTYYSGEGAHRMVMQTYHPSATYDSTTDVNLQGAHMTERGPDYQLDIDQAWRSDGEGEWEREVRAVGERVVGTPIGGLTVRLDTSAAADDSFGISGTDGWSTKLAFDLEQRFGPDGVNRVNENFEIRKGEEGYTYVLGTGIEWVNKKAKVDTGVIIAPDGTAAYYVSGRKMWETADLGFTISNEYMQINGYKEQGRWRFQGAFNYDYATSEGGMAGDVSVKRIGEAFDAEIGTLFSDESFTPYARLKTGFGRAGDMKDEFGRVNRRGTIFFEIRNPEQGPQADVRVSYGGARWFCEAAASFTQVSDGSDIGFGARGGRKYGEESEVTGGYDFAMSPSGEMRHEASVRFGYRELGVRLGVESSGGTGTDFMAGVGGSLLNDVTGRGEVNYSADVRADGSLGFELSYAQGGSRLADITMGDTSKAVYGDMAVAGGEILPVKAIPYKPAEALKEKGMGLGIPEEGRTRVTRPVINMEEIKGAIEKIEAGNAGAARAVSGMSKIVTGTIAGMKGTISPDDVGPGKEWIPAGTTKSGKPLAVNATLPTVEAIYDEKTGHYEIYGGGMYIDRDKDSGVKQRVDSDLADLEDLLKKWQDGYSERAELIAKLKEKRELTAAEAAGLHEAIQYSVNGLKGLKDKAEALRKDIADLMAGIKAANKEEEAYVNRLRDELGKIAEKLDTTLDEIDRVLEQLDEALAQYEKIAGVAAEKIAPAEERLKADIPTWEDAGKNVIKDKANFKVNVIQMANGVMGRVAQYEQKWNAIKADLDEKDQQELEVIKSDIRSKLSYLTAPDQLANVTEHWAGILLMAKKEGVEKFNEVNGLIDNWVYLINETGLKNYLHSDKDIDVLDEND